jgi:hypothetical protein
MPGTCDRKRGLNCSCSEFPERSRYREPPGQFKGHGTGQLLGCTVDCNVHIAVRLLDASCARRGKLSQNPASLADLAVPAGDVRQTDRDVIHLPHKMVEDGHEAQPHVVPERIVGLETAIPDLDPHGILL